MSRGIRWTDPLLAHLPPGRGVGLLPPPPKKPPTLTTLWNGAHAGFRVAVRVHPNAAHVVFAVVTRNSGNTTGSDRVIPPNSQEKLFI